LLKSVLRDTMAVSGALFALLVAATMFTLVLRAFGSDRWIAAQLLSLGNHPWLVLAAVLGIVAACAFVLDAFEMIFVVIPLVMPPLLVQFPDAVWVAVLTLLILQASFLLPPFGYALMMIRSRSARTLDTGKLVRALLPYLLAQLLVLAVVVLWPNLLWRDPAMSATPRSSPLPAASESLEDMLNRQQVPAPAPNEAAPVIR
jgi:TRAP-type mannitol/chloroaromatic compound transport system permease large subunit